MAETKMSGDWLKSLAIWLVFIPCAVLNGGLREKVLPLLMGKGAELPVSGVLLCFLILAVCTGMAPYRIASMRKLFVR